MHIYLFILFLFRDGWPSIESTGDDGIQNAQWASLFTILGGCRRHHPVSDSATPPLMSGILIISCVFGSLKNLRSGTMIDNWQQGKSLACPALSIQIAGHCHADVAFHQL